MHTQLSAPGTRSQTRSLSLHPRGGEKSYNKPRQGGETMSCTHYSPQCSALSPRPLTCGASGSFKASFLPGRLWLMGPLQPSLLRIVLCSSARCHPAERVFRKMSDGRKQHTARRRPGAVVNSDGSAALPRLTEFAARLSFFPPVSSWLRRRTQRPMRDGGEATAPSLSASPQGSFLRRASRTLCHALVPRARSAANSRLLGPGDKTRPAGSFRVPWLMPRD